MSGGSFHITAALSAVVLVALMPLSTAITPPDMRQARVVVAALCIAAAAACALSRAERSRWWTVVAAVSGLTAVAVLIAHLNAASPCVATYNTRPVLIGREYTAAGANYAMKNPGLSPSDLLLDAGGVPERVWTSSSISACRFWIGWGGLLPIPFVVITLCALVGRRSYRVKAGTPATAPFASASPPGEPAVYDVFISYRHTEEDRRYAEEILEALEAKHFRVAIDFRDFVPNQHFLSEMERCVKTSRFVLCLVTSRYLESGHTSEEALISKTLDMADRRMRLVPLIFEQVELPVWLHGLVGIDFRPSARVDPIERLIGLVGQDNDELDRTGHLRQSTH